jgi:hypothetical protein
MVSAPDYVRANLKVIREEMFYALDQGLNALRELIRKEFPDLVHKVGMPIIYEFVIKDTLKKNVRRQVDIVLHQALRYDGKIATLDAIIEETFQEYYKYDMTNQHCDHNHPRFPEVEEVIKLSYRARVSSVWQLLQFQGATNYDDLIRNVFKTREMTRMALEEHYIITDKVIDLIEQYPELVRNDIYNKVYWARNIRIIRASYEYAQQYLQQKLDKLFPEGKANVEN